jgi:2-haloacid dehalogenase
MASRSYQWLFFDADGTLFDFVAAETIALKQVFLHHGMPYDPAYLKAFQHINGELWQALEQKRVTLDVLKVRRFDRLLASLGIKHPPGPFGEVYLEYLGECAHLISGADKLLRSLHGRYRIAILTNGLRTVQRGRLSRSTIRDCISEVVISEEIGFAKPAREYFDVAFERVGNPDKSAVLMIGDGWGSDILGAAEYGIDTCWYNPGKQPRPASPAITHEIATLEELPTWLGVR